MNRNTNGMVMAAVAMRTGWKALGSMLMPARLRNGIGKTVNSQKAIIMPNR